MKTDILTKITHAENTATQFGFQWPDYEMIIDQIVSECDEIKEAITQKESPQRLQEEIGDLLHASMSLCLFLGFDLHETLALTTKKFIHRTDALMAIAKQRGLTTLEGQSVKFILDLWQEAKECDAPLSND